MTKIDVAECWLATRAAEILILSGHASRACGSTVYTEAPRDVFDAACETARARGPFSPGCTTNLALWS
jgi:hypothetical protein